MTGLPISVGPPPSIALFIPAHNEALNVGEVVAKSFEFFSSRGIVDTTVIVVNDGSIDNTGEVLEDLAQTYPLKVVTHPVNSGYGRALDQASPPPSARVMSGSHIATLIVSSTRQI